MDNYNWSVSKTQELPINSTELWDIISHPSNLEFYHPFCAENPIINWADLNYQDEVHYYNGLIYERKFIKWINNIGYDLYIGEKNKPKSFVSWRIFENKNKSRLSIKIYPYIFNTNYKVIDFLPYFLFIKPNLKLYLNSIMKGLLYYINSKQPVVKNQFGNHIWFSNS